MRRHLRRRIRELEAERDEYRRLYLEAVPFLAVHGMLKIEGLSISTDSAEVVWAGEAMTIPWSGTPTTTAITMRGTS